MESQSGVIGGLFVVASSILLAAHSLRDRSSESSALLILSIVLGLLGLILVMNYCVFSKPRKP